MTVKFEDVFRQFFLAFSFFLTIAVRYYELDVSSRRCFCISRTNVSKSERGSPSLFWLNNLKNNGSENDLIVFNFFESLIYILIRTYKTILYEEFTGTCATEVIEILFVDCGFFSIFNLDHYNDENSRGWNCQHYKAD